jgi:hypothetical protein
MAWTVTASWTRDFEWTNGQNMHVFRFACTADANASGDQTLSTLLATAYGSDEGARIMRELVAGGMPYQIKYLPSGGATDPTSNPTVTIDDENGVNIFSQEFTASTESAALVNAVLGGYLAVTDIILASTTLGNTKVASFDVWVLK